MDTSRLPSYRSSYLLRFHPYPRAKPSVRERIMAAAEDEELYEPPVGTDTLHLESETLCTLNQAIHGAEVHNETKLRQRRLSMSSLIIDLALLLAKTLSFMR